MAQFVNIIHYFKEDYSTGEIQDKIWLGNYWKMDKMFFDLRKDMIQRATRKNYTIMLIDRPRYFHKVVDAGDGNSVIYTLKINKKKVAEKEDYTLTREDLEKV